VQSRASVSLNQSAGGADESELGDAFPDPDVDDPLEEADEAQRGQTIRRALAALPEREHRIVELRYGFVGEPWTLDAIGHELSLTRERVRQLEARALARMGRRLAA